MKVIGITGNSGSGKSYISNILLNRLKNSIIIDADKIAKQMSNIDTLYYKEIVSEFGEDILNETKEINRKKLATIIYNNKEKRELLNSITFKHVVEEIKNRINKNSNKDYIILDVPLLFESNTNKICNLVIGVIAEKNIKIDRICKRDGINKNDAIKRINAQLSNEILKRKCDFIIENNGDIGKINKQLDKIF